MTDKTFNPEKMVRYSRSFVMRVVIVAALASFLLALTGPFNTYNQGDFLTRLLFWFTIVFVSLGIAAVVKPLAWKVAPNSRAVREIVSLSFFLPVFLPFLWYFIGVMFPSQGAERTTFGYLFVNLVAICIVISILTYMLPALFVRAQGAQVRPSSSFAPRLQRRLAEDFSGDILRLSGDGHYVKVSTTEGVFDVRMRLSDAVDEMSGVPGFWTHRSHWVATDSIRDWRCTKHGKTVLVLNNADEVPVSAKYHADLEDAGYVLRRGIETEKA